MMGSLKIWAYVAMLSMAVGLFWGVSSLVTGYGDNKYQAGYDKAVQEQQAAALAAGEENDKLLQAALAAARLEWQAEQDIINAGFVAENTIAEGISDAEKEIFRAEIESACIDPGSNVLRLWNNIICAASGGGGRCPEPTGSAQPD